MLKSRKHQPITLSRSDVAREDQVQQEIENFLRALSSYPDRFACDPALSFEQHLFRIAAANPSHEAGAERRRN